MLEISTDVWHPLISMLHNKINTELHAEINEWLKEHSNMELKINFQFSIFPSI